MIEKITKTVNLLIEYTHSLKNRFKSKIEINDDIHVISKMALNLNEGLSQQLPTNLKKSCVSSPWKCSNVDCSEYSNDQRNIHNLLRGNYEKINSFIFDINYFKSLFLKENPNLFLEGKAVLKKMFEDLYIDLSSNNYNNDQILNFKIIIGELLSLYPYLKPENGNTIKVPILINWKWTFIEYTVEEISFIPKKLPVNFIPVLGSPIVAYGLTPIDLKDTAPPLLLFKGTTFPTDKGFSLSLIADFFPLTSVGAFAFWLGKEEIKSWLSNATTFKRALVFGKSLGGSL
ncbi:MAG: hypothetical protein Q8K60_03685, partial [Parachlamydiaceae bacterium]|nr:hypothetical protein [Parachlamydiaceae bacterium]